MAGWLNRQADLIAECLDALVADVHTIAPVWARALTLPPQGADEQQVWRSHMRALVAYRDRYAITGVDPLGPEPGDGAQRDAYRDAATALTGLTPLRGGHPPSEQADQISARLAALRRRSRVQGLLDRARRTRTPEPGPEPDLGPTRPGPAPGRGPHI